MDISKLMEFHSDEGVTTVIDEETGIQVDRPEGYEPPVQESV